MANRNKENDTMTKQQHLDEYHRAMMAPFRQLVARAGDLTGAFARHAAAWEAPQGFERPVVQIVRSLAEYAAEHAARYESPIGEDGVMGDCWADIARGAIRLLNGETGNLDCGSVESGIRALAKAVGFEDEL
jgi:hypothetical protein